MAIAPGVRVRDLNNPGRVGTVLASPTRTTPTGVKWNILWDGSGPQFEYESDLEEVDATTNDPYSLARNGRFGRAEDFRRNLTFVHLTGRLANLVYSMGATNTEFYAHQYVPLLAMLDSPCNGLLIADEVGLGKTIEAGLIWTELRARYEKKRLLVVCPAMLREKWRDELELRFGVRATISTTKDLLSTLERGVDDSIERAWIVSYQSARPPKKWQADTGTLQAKPRTSERLANLLHSAAQDSPIFDLVVFDEAHNMRNQDTGNWTLGSLLRETAEFQVMLSATPINLKNDDLFSLLTLLDPDRFSTKNELSLLIEANAPLVRARDIVLNTKTSVRDFESILGEARRHPLMRSSRLLKQLIDSVPREKDYSNPSVRARLAESLERVNLLSHVLTRTRKRDVQANRVKREVHREAVQMTTAERHVYDLVTETIRTYAAKRDIHDGFLLAMPQRQLCSSPAALMLSWKKEIDALAEEDFLAEYDIDDLSDNSSRPLRAKLIAAVGTKVSAEELERNDSKFQRLLSVLEEVFANNPAEKVIVFTAFRPTASYLVDRLKRKRISTSLVWGSQDRPKHEVIKEFKEDSSIRVLVSTEVAAEGVDLQFCRMLVNYDLPWNPTKVEQRIGRIDRLGQESNRIFVWNLFYEDSIDDRIVSRLIERLRVFEEALGEAEAVVGEQILKLEYALLSRPMTREEEEALIASAALALENVALQRKALEDNAPHMMAHGQRVLEKINAAHQLARHVTDGDLFSFVRDALVKYWPGHEFTADTADPMQVRLRLSPDMIAELDPFLRQRSAVGRTKLLAGHPVSVRFRNKIAESTILKAEVIHQFHPLVAFLTDDLKRREESFYPLLALKVRREHLPKRIPIGVYVFWMAQLSFSGATNEEWLASSVSGLTARKVMDAELSDLLTDAVRLHGEDWLEATHTLNYQQITDVMSNCELAIDERFETTKESKLAENADRVDFQLESIRRHSIRRCARLNEIRDSHVRAGTPKRKGLAAATAKELKAFEERIAVRVATVEAARTLQSQKSGICAGVFLVED